VGLRSSESLSCWHCSASTAPWQFDQRDVGQYYKPPSAQHLFGTTQAGFDVMSRTVRGLGKSLIIGFMVADHPDHDGRAHRSSAAYIGGLYEKAWLWVIDLMLVLPSFFLIAIVSKGGPKGQYAWLLLVVLLAAFGWQLSAPRRTEPVDVGQGARVRRRGALHGTRHPPPAGAHIIPNIASMLIVDVCLGSGTPSSARPACPTSGTASKRRHLTRHAHRRRCAVDHDRAVDLPRAGERCSSCSSCASNALVTGCAMHSTRRPFWRQA